MTVSPPVPKEYVGKSSAPNEGFLRTKDLRLLRRESRVQEGNVVTAAARQRRSFARHIVSLAPRIRYAELDEDVAGLTCKPAVTQSR